MNFQNQQQGIAPSVNPASVNIGFQDLPAIPNLPLKWPQTTQFIQAIAVTLCNMAARQALTNSARTLVFNKIVENRLSNQFFFGLIVTAADLVGLGMAKQQVNQNNVQSVIQSTCDDVLTAYTANTILSEQFIAQYAGPDVINNARNTLQAFKRLTDEISYFFQNQQQNHFQPSGFQSNQFGNSNFQQPMGSGMPTTNFNNRTFGAPQQDNSVSFFQQNNPSTFPGVMGQVDLGVSRFPTTPSPAPTTEAVFVKVPENVPGPDNEQPKKLKWKPSVLQQHQIAFDPLVYKVVLITRVLDGEEIVVEKLVELTEKEKQMEWDKHRLQTNPVQQEITRHVEIDMYRIPTVEEMKSAPIEAEHRIEVTDAIQGGNNRIEMDDGFLVKAGVAASVCEDKEGENLVWKESFTVSDAIMTTKFHHTQMKNSRSKMRRERFMVPKVFVCKHEIRRIAEVAFKDKNFLITAMKLKEILAKDNTTIEQKEFIYELDRYMAQLINMFICDYLSITDMMIDSLIGDVPTIFDGYIELKYGKFVFDKFKENQHRIYDNFLKIIDEEDEIAVVAEQYGKIPEEFYDDENGDVCLLVLEQNYSVTSVRLSSDETRLDRTTSVTSKVIDGLYPAMVQYCRNLFENKECENNNWAGHLLITTNGKIYNFMESPFNRKTYLAKEFDPQFLTP